MSNLATLLKMASASGPLRLTGDAGFYAAVMAGVPATPLTGGDKGTIVLGLTNPVDVWVIDGIVKVFSREAVSK